MNLIAIILSLFIIPSAFGLVQYPFLSPIGDIESLMSNTGVGLRKSVGGVAFNPASLARLEGADLSASASTYNIMDSKTETEEGFKSFTTYAPLPTTVFSGKEFGQWYFAFSILVPTNLEVSSRYELLQEETETYGNMIFNDKVDETLIGLTGAFELDENWSFGLNVHVHYYTESATEGTIAPIIAGEKNGAINRQIKNSVYSLQFVLGTHHSPWKWFNWGLRVQFPNIRFAGHGTFYEEILLNDPSAPSPTTYQQTDQTHEPEYQVPFDFVLGLNFRVAKNHRILLDLGMQLETDFYKIPNLLEYRIHTKTQGRFNLGYRWSITEKWSLLGGLKWNPSPKIENPLPSALPPINFFGGSLGVYITGKVTHTGIGLYYYKSRTDYQIWGEVSDPSRVILWGVILTSGIKF